jgi:hypothetical protein
MPRFISRGSATSVDDFKQSRMEFDNVTNLDGVVELHAAFLKRKPHTRSCLLLRNRKSGYAGARGTRPAQPLQR